MDGHISDLSSVSAHTAQGSKFSEERREAGYDADVVQSTFQHQRVGGVMQLTLEDLQESAQHEENCVIAYWHDYRVLRRPRIQNYLETHWVMLGFNIGKLSFMNKLPSKEAMLAAIHNSPYAISGGMLAIRRWDPMIPLSRIRVTKIMVAMQIYGLSSKCFFPDISRKLVNYVGDAVDLDLYCIPVQDIRYIRARILVNPDNPLIPGFYVDMPDGRRYWLSCRYERVHN